MLNRILVPFLTVAALAVVPSALGAGGLALTPAVVEHAAKPGTVGAITVDNSSAVALKVTVTPRPWKQARSGAVAPDKAKSLLAQVGVSARSFTPAAGARKSVTLTLKGRPSGGALYGAVDVVGLPTAATRRSSSGVVTGYRLIGSLRLTPASKRLHLRAGAVRVRGGRIVLPVTNTGNTIDPVAGSVRLTGASGGRTVGVAATKVLPGATVELPLGSAKGLPKGRFTARAALTQGGRTVLRASKAFTLK